MQKGRLLWAAAMCAIAVTVLMGYTEAGALQSVEEAPRTLPEVRLPALSAPETAEDAAETPDPPPEADARALWLTVLDADGGMLRVAGADGAEPAAAAVNDRGEAAFLLPPGRYTLEDEAGRAGTFTLAENAAILDAAGDARTDGELLYLGPMPDP